MLPSDPFSALKNSLKLSAPDISLLQIRPFFSPSFICKSYFICYFLEGWLDSNPRSQDQQSMALSLCSHPCQHCKNGCKKFEHFTYTFVYLFLTHIYCSHFGKFTIWGSCGSTALEHLTTDPMILGSNPSIHWFQEKIAENHVFQWNQRIYETYHFCGDVINTTQMLRFVYSLDSL